MEQLFLLQLSFFPDYSSLRARRKKRRRRRRRRGEEMGRSREVGGKGEVRSEIVRKVKDFISAGLG